MILILNCGSSKVPLIEKIVNEMSDFETISFTDFNPDLLFRYKGIIISGAPLLITEQDMSPFVSKVSWLKKTNIPVLGICFGHQLIGLTFQAYASRCKEDRDWQLIEIAEKSILFNNLPIEVEMMEDHCETISVPPNFKLIASSDLCINEAMQHIKLPLFGVQFHPEVSGKNGYIVLENFIQLCNN